MSDYNKFVFITYMEHYGGIETLVLRMLKWLKKCNVDMMIIIDFDRKEDQEMLAEIKALTDSVFRLPFRSFCSKDLFERLEFKKKDKIKMIVFTYPEYFLAQYIKKYYKDTYIDIVFYVPHQLGLIMDFNFNNSILKFIVSKYAKYLCRRMVANNEIIHMDYLCSKRLYTEYGVLEESAPVIPLAMEINSVDYDKITEIYTSKGKNILSIARSEFPFKGYLFGLIDCFERIIETYSDATLTIISNGPDFVELKEKVNTSQYKDNIELINGVAYKELNSYFDKARLYVGMGTTILDAANRSVLALPVGSYTYDLRGYDYYYKDGMNLGGLYGKIDIFPLILDSLKMEKEQYIRMIEMQQREIARYYDIESVMNKIDGFKNKSSKGAFTDVEIFFLNILKRLITLRRKME